MEILEQGFLKSMKTVNMESQPVREGEQEFLTMRDIKIHYVVSDRLTGHFAFSLGWSSCLQNVNLKITIAPSGT